MLVILKNVDLIQIYQKKIIQKFQKNICSTYNFTQVIKLFPDTSCIMLYYRIFKIDLVAMYKINHNKASSDGSHTEKYINMTLFEVYDIVYCFRNIIVILLVNE